MSVFTTLKKGDLRSAKTVFVKLDSKGRISIPSFLRKNFNLQEGEEVRLVFDLRENYFIVQNGVKVSTNDCELLSPGSNPGSGLVKRREL